MQHRTAEHDAIALEALREQRTDIAEALGHARALTHVASRMWERNRTTAIKLGGYPLASYVGPGVSIATVVGRMCRVYNPEILRALEAMVAALDRRESGNV